MASVDLREDLNCSICLQLYTDPVTLKCGHNFCQGCIKSVLDTQEVSGIYSCPECRAQFQEHPALTRNTTLCNIVEHFLSTQPKQDNSRNFCTYCLYLPVPAFKTCLLCEASLCDNHIRVHSKSTEHILTELTTDSVNRKCSTHKKLLEYYCSEDAVCICASCCLIGEHKGHQVESLNEASEEKKKQLKIILEKITTMRHVTRLKVESLQQHEKNMIEKATDITERVISMFQDIKHQLEALQEQILNEISKQKRNVSLKVSDFIQKLEEKEVGLLKKISNIEELFKSADPVTVLQGWESIGDKFFDEMEEEVKEDDDDEEDDETYEEDSEEEVNEEDLYDENELSYEDELVGEVNLCRGTKASAENEESDGSDSYKYVEELDDDDEELEDHNEEEKTEEEENEDIDANDDINSAAGSVDEVLISVMLHKGLAVIVNDVKAKNGFYVEEASDMVLDIHTAADDILLSSDLKAARWTLKNPNNPAPERFDSCQVLSTIGFISGRHFWEVDTSQSEF